MNYIYEFDIAAVVIELIVIFFFHQKKNLPNMQNKLFLILIYVITGVSILDFSLIWIYNTRFPRFLAWFLHCLYYSGTNILAFLCATYCSAMVDFQTEYSRKRQVLFVKILPVPCLFTFVTIWISPFVSKYYVMTFTLLEGNVYQRGGLFFYLIYLNSVFYMIISFYMVIRYKSRLQGKNVRLLHIYLTGIIISVLAQMLFPNLLIECFGIAVSTLIFFFYMQRPEEVLDAVTESFNYNAFFRMTNVQFKKQTGHVCISLILDDASFLTSTLGITQMNSLMAQVAEFLKNTFPLGMVYHLDQGVFCMVSKSMDPLDLYEHIVVMQERFKETWKTESVEIKLFNRICVVKAPSDTDSPAGVIDIINFVKEDVHYKQAVIYASDIDFEYKKHSKYIEEALHEGFANNRFELYYQPIYSTKDNMLIGAEALIRLHDLNGDIIPPDDFIPIAERNGMIYRIGEYVFDSVCKMLSQIDTVAYGIKKLSINLSAAQCMQEILAEQILTLQKMYQLPSSLINLEITETAVVHTPEILLKNMKLLSDAGIEFSLDDYGSVYSNMAAMLDLPFKMVKIDKKIIQTALNDARSTTAIAATVSMIRSLGMTVLAEGVETKEQADWLISLGCNYLQGFYYSKPVTKDEYLMLMKKNKMIKCIKTV